MATAAQIAANRANARKSTGPRTLEGKQKTSMNPLKHGLTATTLVLPHEDDVAFQIMRADLYNQYSPATPQECMLVDQLASAWWRTIRVRQVETDMLDLQVQTLKSSYPDKKSSPKSDRQALAVRVVTESEKDFNNFLRYDANIERAFYRASNHLERIQAARLRRQERLADTYAEISPEPPPPRRVLGVPIRLAKPGPPPNDRFVPFESPLTATNHKPDDGIGFVSYRPPASVTITSTMPQRR
jgi:hypothetical protein